MKLRISKRQLRLRLTPEDIEQLLEMKDLEIRLQLTTQVVWGCRLKVCPESEPKVQGQNSQIEIHVPKGEFRSWLQGEDLAWTYAQTEPELSVLIEKDLKPKRR